MQTTSSKSKFIIWNLFTRFSNERIIFHVSTEQIGKVLYDVEAAQVPRKVLRNRVIYVHICMQTKEKKKKTCTWTDTQIHEWELVISSLNGTQSGDGGGNVDSYENCEKLDTILNWWIHVDNDEHSRSSQSRKHFHFIPRKLYHSKYPPTDWKKVNDFQQQIHIFFVIFSENVQFHWLFIAHIL